MNERIRELAVQAKLRAPVLLQHWGKIDALTDSEQEELQNVEKFAELIVQECVNQCRREWYDLNNAAPKENETLRDIGIRVGQKNGVLKTISRIKEHFGIGEQTVPIVSADDRALFAGIGSSESFTVEGAKKAFGIEERMNERERLEELTRVTLDAKAGSERFCKKHLAEDQ